LPCKPKSDCAIADHSCLDFILHLFAALAEKERALIATRTKAALAAAKARGANVIPVIHEVRRAGATTLREIAQALNARGISTPRGGQWHATSVTNAARKGVVERNAGLRREFIVMGGGRTSASRI
jgi:DNA invertase Pin-like site-specific DNA recombinase